MSEPDTTPEPTGSGESPQHTRPTLHVLLQSLRFQALLQLGELVAEEGAEPHVDLTQAKFTIDLLQLLREKTEGNRTDDESEIMDALLYDLRMKYVARSSQR